MSAMFYCATKDVRKCTKKCTQKRYLADCANVTKNILYIR